MFSTAYVANNKEKWAKKNDDVTRGIVVIFILLLILDVLIIIFTIQSLLFCSKVHKWDSLVTFLLIVSLFIPGVGGIVGLSIIIYYFLNCRRQQ